MKLSLVFAVIGLAILGGCATGADPNYLARLEAQSSVEKLRAQADLERAKADTARMVALQKIGESGDTQAKQFAAFALALGGNHGGGQTVNVPVQMPEPPVQAHDTALKWASIIVPSATAVASGYFGYKLGVAQSNNNANATIAGYNTFGSIANGGFTALSTTAGRIQAPQPNISIGGNGVIGAGTYTSTLNTNSNNRNCVGGNGANGGPGGNGTTAGGPGAAGGLGGAASC